MSGRYLVSFDSAPDLAPWWILSEAIGGLWEHIPPESRPDVQESLDRVKPSPYEPRLVVREALGGGGWNEPGWQAIYTFEARDSEPLLTSVEVKPRGGVPDSGITRRLVKGLATGGAYTAAREYLHDHLEAIDQGEPLALLDRLAGAPDRGDRSAVEARERSAKILARYLPDFQWTIHDAGYTVADALKGPHRPGSRGRSDKWYAAFCGEYVELLASGSRRPVAELAKRHSLTPTYVRDILHEARRRGLLTDPPRGRAGGRLTPKAIELLSPERQTSA